MIKLFYELIQVTLGNSLFLSHTPSDDEWYELYDICQKQSVTGYVFEALDGLSKRGQKLPLPLLYQWIGEAEQIKQRNKKVNKRCVEITQIFADAGFRTCILKGQGNAMMYPNPLARTSGDIDAWLMVDGSKCSVIETKKKIDDLVKSRFPNIKGGMMHIEFPVFKDVVVEVHYIPRYMYAPKHNRRLQTFFQEKANEQFYNELVFEGVDGVCFVPTAEFNLIHQLSHMMSHMMGEGIGLRQFIDYYYVLKTFYNSQFANHNWSDELYDMGLLKFAQGVMWILKELLGLDDMYLIVEPSEKIGRAIQQTIEDGGNFGRYNQLNTLRHKNSLGRFIGGAQQSFHAMRYFPTEAIWKLLRKVI